MVKALLYKSRYSALLFYLCLGFSSGAHARAQEQRTPPAPEGPGKQLFVTVCSQCHTLKSTLIMRDGQQGWQETMNRMVLYGAQLSPSEADTITHYLVTELGPRSAHLESGPTSGAGSSRHGESATASRAIALPEGPGKELVATRCTLCHTLEKSVGIRRTPADWQATVIDMQQRGMSSTPDEIRAIIAYLEKNFSTAQPISLGTHPQATPSQERGRPSATTTEGE